MRPHGAHGAQGNTRAHKGAQPCLTKRVMHSRRALITGLEDAHVLQDRQECILHVWHD